MGTHFSSCLVRGINFGNERGLGDIYKAIEEIQGVEGSNFGDALGGQTQFIVFEQDTDDYVKLTDEYGGVEFGVYSLYHLVTLLGDKEEFPVLARALETLYGMGYPHKTVADLNIYYCSNVN